MDAQLYAFDIFDTVLTRTVARPADVFAIVWNALPEPLRGDTTQDDFVRARIAAEQDARRGAANRETTMPVIAAELAKRLGLPTDAAGGLVEAERRAERSVARPIEHTAAKLRELRERGQRVVFVTDMYHPAEFLAELLGSCGVEAAAGEIFVSGTWGRSKAQGLLRCVVDVLGVPRAACRYVGNSPWSDVWPARRAGIPAEHFDAGNLSRREQRFAKSLGFGPTLPSRLIAAARRVRLEALAQDEWSRGQVEVAASVVAPLALCFVSSALLEAHRRGLDRVYFPARDGQLLAAVAARVAERAGIAVEPRYFYGSRQAWLLAGTTSLGAFETAWILEDSKGLTLARVARRLAMSPQGFAAWLAELGVSAAELGDGREGADGASRSGAEALEAPLGVAARAALAGALASSRASELLGSHAATVRASVIGYLRQEGVLADAPTLVADVGWRGRMILALGNVARIAGAAQPEAWFIGAERHPSCAAVAPKVHGWLYDGWRGTGLEARVPIAIPLVESFFRAEHGSVMGYAQRGGRWVPTFGSAPSARELARVRAVHAAVLRVVDELEFGAEDLRHADGLRSAVGVLLRDFALLPTEREAASWGGFEHDHDQSSDDVAPLAVRRSAPDVLRALVGATSSDSERQAWTAAERRLSDPLTAGLLAARQLGQMARNAAVVTKWRFQASRERGD